LFLLGAKMTQTESSTSREGKNEFVGQVKLIREFGLIYNEVISGKNHNILLSAPSGFGKTTLGTLFMNGCGLWQGYISGPPDFKIDLARRIQFMDEIHELKYPENIYKYMDSNEHTFIFATNETGLLKEPLINRCIVLEFDEYTDEEASKIIQNNIGELPYEIIKVIIQVTSKIPRQISVLCKRLEYVFRSYGIPENEEFFMTLLSEVLDIDSRGYSPLQRQYINFLEDIGGSASITTLTYGLKINETTIIRDIEPKLIYDKVLTISSKGRILNLRK
jgi:Holliday junction resolvasome RuvABC ATP-dependent DNA helicase subunit